MLGARVDRDDSRQGPRLGDVDGRDQRVGDRAAHERRVEHPRQLDVVDVAAGTGEDAAVLRARHARPDEPLRGEHRGHRGSPTSGRGEHAVDDRLVARAATEVPRQRLAYLRLGRRRVLAEQRRHLHEEARRAEAALKGVLVTKRLLQRVHDLARGEALDRRDARAAGLHGEHETRAHRFAVEEHGARAAHAVLAPEVRARELEILAEEVGEGLASLGGALPALAVHLECDRNWDSHRNSVGHEASFARAAASVNARAHQHLRDRATIRGARVQVGGRFEVARRERGDLVDRRSLSHRGFGLDRSDRPVGHVDERDAHVAVGRDRCRGSDHREVAVAARHLLHRHTGAGRGVRERDLREDLVGLERGREVADEEVGRADRAGATGAASPRRSRRGRARSPGARRRDRREQGCRRSCRGCGSRHVRCRERRPRAAGPASRRPPSARALGDGSSRRSRSSR